MSTLHLFTALLIAVLALSCAMVSLAQEELSQQLEEMDDVALEMICTDRGFELLRDEANPFSHEQYVKAARQCLELEAEMNKLLEENPELLEEFQAAEEAALKDEAAADPAPSTTDTDAAASATSTTATTAATSTTSSTTPPPSSPPDAGEGADLTSDADAEVLDLDDEAAPDVDPVSPPAAARTTDDDVAPDTTTTTSTTPTSTEEGDASAPHAAAAAASAPPPAGEEGLGDLSKANTLNPAGLSLAEFWSEFKAKVSQDANAVVNTVIPKPLRGPVKGAVKTAMKVTKGVVKSVTSTARRYIVAFVESRKSGSQDATEGGGERLEL